jgi:uncharacterized repeat protein (TIGR03803 family)
VFELTPPATLGGAWSESILHSFTGGSDGGYPYAGLFDAAGNLYGTTGGGGATNRGTVFALAPPAPKGATWSERVLYSFRA